MSRTVFVAGATGVIGSRLLPLLTARGYRVFGLTRAQGKADALWIQGVVPVVGDVFNTASLTSVIRAARPDAVVHMLTDLPPDLAPGRMEEGIRRNSRIRSEGTRSLIAATRSAGVAFMVAQSIAWAYRPGNEPHTEEASFDVHATGVRAVSVAGIVALENAVMNTPGLAGVVLRFGQLYGPGTGASDAKGKNVPLHVDAAALATVLALESKHAGIYNIVGPNQQVNVEKATRQLSWSHNRWPLQ